MSRGLAALAVAIAVAALTSCAPRIATDKIERQRTNRRVKQPAVINVVVATPELDKSVLNNVFRVGG